MIIGELVYTIKFSKEEVINALRHYAKDIHNRRIDGCVDAAPIFRSEELPGFDPHDCEYVDVFDGITLKVKG